MIPTTESYREKKLNHKIYIYIYTEKEIINSIFIPLDHQMCLYWGRIETRDGKERATKNGMETGKGVERRRVVVNEGEEQHS